MKYWQVYYDSTDKMYKFHQMLVPDAIEYIKDPQGSSGIAIFKTFDMAYQYVTRLNGTNDVQAYSKWAQR